VEKLRFSHMPNRSVREISDSDIAQLRLDCPIGLTEVGVCFALSRDKVDVTIELLVQLLCSQHIRPQLKRVRLGTAFWPSRI